MKDRVRRLLQSAVDVGSATALGAAGVAIASGHPVTGATAGLLAGAQPMLVRAVEWLSDAKHRQELGDELDREFFENVQEHLDALCRLLETVQHEAQRTHWKAVGPEETLILIEQYREHSHRSAQAERRSMLAAAAAASFRPDYDVEMKSRAERALANLEPSDIAALRAYIKHQDVAGGYWSNMRVFFSDLPFANRQALLQAGCISLSQHLDTGESDFKPAGRQQAPRLRENPIVTPIGGAVLNMLATYKPDEAAANANTAATAVPPPNDSQPPIADG